MQYFCVYAFVSVGPRQLFTTGLNILSSVSLSREDSSCDLLYGWRIELPQAVIYYSSFLMFIRESDRRWESGGVS